MEREFHRSQEKLQFAFLWHYILSVQRCSELKGDKAAKSGEIEAESGDEHNHTENHKPCNMSKESGNSIPIPHKGQGIAEKLTLEFTFRLWYLMGLLVPRVVSESWTFNVLRKHNSKPLKLVHLEDFIYNLSYDIHTYVSI